MHHIVVREYIHTVSTPSYLEVCMPESNRRRNRRIRRVIITLMIIVGIVMFYASCSGDDYDKHVEVTEFDQGYTNAQGIVCRNRPVLRSNDFSTPAHASGWIVCLEESGYTRTFVVVMNRDSSYRSAREVDPKGFDVRLQLEPGDKILVVATDELAAASLIDDPSPTYLPDGATQVLNDNNETYLEQE